MNHVLPLIIVSARKADTHNFINLKIFISSLAQRAISLDSHEPNRFDSVPIFEVLPTNNIEDYSRQPALKHIDSLLLYARFKTKRWKTTLEIGEGKPLRFITFYDEGTFEHIYLHTSIYLC